MKRFLSNLSKQYGGKMTSNKQCWQTYYKNGKRVTKSAKSENGTQRAVNLKISLNLQMSLNLVSTQTCLITKKVWG